EHDWAVTRETLFYMHNVIARKRHQDEEKRYDNLFSLTEKLHSTIQLNVVLKELLHTLNEVYPTFNHTLFFTSDYIEEEDIPLRDLAQLSATDKEHPALHAYQAGEVTKVLLEEHEGIQLFLPLVGHQSVYGVLQVDCVHNRDIPLYDVEFLTMVANIAAKSIENAQVYEEKVRDIRNLKIINETAKQLGASLRLPELIHYMVQTMEETVRADAVAFITVNEDDPGNYRVLPNSSEFFSDVQSHPYIAYAILQTLTGEKPLFNIHMNMGCLDLEEDAPIRYRSLMAVPMHAQDQFTGFVIVLGEKAGAFTFNQFTLLQSLVQHSALALANVMLREELELMVVTDYLTKLHSRKYLDEKIRYSMEHDHQGVFLLIDVDDFKRVNDLYGHQTGDEILVQISMVIKQNVRGDDIAARWGGEEIAVYLPKADKQVGIQVGEQILKKIASETNPSVTVSMGLACWAEDTADDPRLLFSRADRALYTAKQFGKNCLRTQE
ncbi:MAG: sensor domain-containing diguanylate cyclase, partial [Bacilli bacterium]